MGLMVQGPCTFDRHQAIPPLISMQGGFGLAIGPMGEANNPEFRL
jgi:hypothetical protein